MTSADPVPTWMTQLAPATPDISDHIRGDFARPCMRCGTPTGWLELNFQGPLCPGDCTDAMWTEFDDYNAAHPIGPLIYRSCCECEATWITHAEYAEEITNQFGAECDPGSVTFCPRCLHDW